MAISVMKDSNNVAVVGSASTRPNFATMVEVTTGAGITETSIASLVGATNQNAQAQVLLNLVVLTNAVYVSVGPAGTPPGSTAPMVLLPATFPLPMKVTGADVSLYHRNGPVGSGTLKVWANQ